MADLPDYAPLALSEIEARLQESLARLTPGEVHSFAALDPDLCAGRYGGERLEIDGERLICRGMRSWVDLATLLGCRLLTPRAIGSHRVLMRFEKLGERSFHKEAGSGKYEAQGAFERIRKNEEPAFAYYYHRALSRLGIEKRRRILDLGLYRGDELEPIRRLADKAWEGMQIVGIDRARDALELAQKRFGQNLQTFCCDINALGTLDLGRFDLILSLGTLQSPGIGLKPLIMRLVQEHLSPDGALLLGWPNARWIDGELLYGARPRHYAFSELSLVVKDLFWIKKYLQQHRFRVVITGREYLFLEATKIG